MWSPPISGSGSSRFFLVDRYGSRPCFGGVQRMQTDPRWRDNLLV